MSAAPKDGSGAYTRRLPGALPILATMAVALPEGGLTDQTTRQRRRTRQPTSTLHPRRPDAVPPAYAGRICQMRYRANQTGLRAIRERRQEEPICAPCSTNEVVIGAAESPSSSRTHQTGAA